MFSLSKIAATITGFFLLCSLAGRLDIPMKMILKLQAETFNMIDKPWGDPSVFPELSHYLSEESFSLGFEFKKLNLCKRLKTMLLES